MDKTIVFGIAQRYANALGASFGSIRVILLGSYAKGNFTGDSDIDIAVVFEDFVNLVDMQLE
jgi:predicted nucleotidyltransferase